MTGRDQKNGAQGVFQSSIRGLAEVLAVAATFFGTPIAYGSTIGWVRDFTIKYYSMEFVFLIEFAWMGITGAAIFFIARASVGTALTAAGAAIVLRFLT